MKTFIDDNIINVINCDGFTIYRFTTAGLFILALSCFSPLISFFTKIFKYN